MTNTCVKGKGRTLQSTLKFIFTEITYKKFIGFFLNRNCMSNLDTVSQQQISCKKCLNDTKLDIACGFKLIVMILTYAVFSCLLSALLFA